MNPFDEVVEYFLVISHNGLIAVLDISIRIVQSNLSVFIIK